MAPTTGRVRGVYVGVVGSLRHGRTSVPSAIVKRRVKGPAVVGYDGIAGDEQADRRNHGGPDKALLVVPVEHYAHGTGRPASGLPVGTLGENLSTLGLREQTVRVGDVISIGEVIAQVSQPRRPCYKLGALHAMPDLAIRLQSVGDTGFYLRVLRPGILRADMPVLLEARAPHGVTVAEVTRVMSVDKHDLVGIEHVLRAGADLPERWRIKLSERLAGRASADGDGERLSGGEMR